jgi:hypothetical protein
VDPVLLDRLHDAGFGAARGEVILATGAEARHVALEVIESLGMDVHLVRNRGALMLIPTEVSKGTGLRTALAELAISPHNALAVGDAENDQAMFGAVELGVAVGNAVEWLRQHADLALDAENGAGVMELLAGPVLSGKRRVHPPRWRITLGRDSAGRPVTVPASQTNILITGETGSGKSYLAGSIIEQLVALGYSVLVVDPEGDHGSLRSLRGIAAFSGPQLPDPTLATSLFRPDVLGVILDLADLDAGAKEQYLARLWPALVAYRDQSGLPHWVMFEEAHWAPCCRTPTCEPVGPFGWGVCLVSYRPQWMASEVLSGMEWHAELSPGGRTGMLKPADGMPIPFIMAERATRHLRHERKYVDFVLPPERRFTFQDDQAQLGPVAANLRQFVAALRVAPAAMIDHHARHGDFSSWVTEVYGDRSLAAMVQATELDFVGHPDSDRTRRLLIDLIAATYLRQPT